MKGYITVKESSEPSEYQGSLLYAHTETEQMNADFQRTYITESLADKLNLKAQTTEKI